MRAARVNGRTRSGVVATPGGVAAYEGGLGQMDQAVQAEAVEDRLVGRRTAARATPLDGRRADDEADARHGEAEAAYVHLHHLPPEPVRHLREPLAQLGHPRRPVPHRQQFLHVVQRPGPQKAERHPGRYLRFPLAPRVEPSRRLPLCGHAAESASGAVTRAAERPTRRQAPWRQARVRAPPPNGPPNRLASHI
ncbi:hypothetical protein WQ59_20350 [Streptomyces sp. KE1]|nr:hypothetical protein WQ59_20350 [Streptomyces sp. KE1]